MSPPAKHVPPRPPGWRRLAAFAVDYLLVILPLLGVAGVIGWLTWGTPLQRAMFGSLWLGQLAAAALVTLPVAAYFALPEASASRGTLGKRALGLAVEQADGGAVPLHRSVLRTGLKFLPWEFFHAIYWHWPGWPTNPTPPSPLQLAGLTLGWIWIGAYVACLFFQSGRTPYDVAVRTRVVRAVRVRSE